MPHHVKVLLAVTTVGILVWQFPLGAQSAPALFKSVVAFGENIDPKMVSGGISVKRFRLVQVEGPLIDADAATAALSARPEAFGPDRPLKDQPILKRLTLNLFEDASVIAELRKVTTSSDKRTIVWSGTIQGSARGTVTLAVTGRSVFGDVHADSHQLFEIRTPAQSSMQLIMEVDPKTFPKESNPIPVKELGEAEDVNPHGQIDSVIDVLVAYTSAAAQAAGGDDQIQSLIETAETNTNSSYENSGVIQRIRIVAKILANYNEAIGFDPLLKRLPSSSDAALKQIRAARDKYGADMVVLLVKINNAGSDEPASCGLSYLAKPPTPAFAPKAFSIVHVACATSNFSFGHELGHLQGCNHDRNHANGPGAYPYSYGYQQANKDPRFRDIMSYDCPDSPCDRINYWSNPDINYQGLPLGDPVTPNGGTDNRLTLNNTRAIAARWRPRTVPLPKP